MGWQEEANSNFKAAVDYAEKGNWDLALTYARKVPKNWDVHQQLAGMKIPPSHIDRFLKELPKDNRPSALFEMSGALHPDLNHDQLQSIFDHTDGEDYVVGKNIQAHPNWMPSKQIGDRAASEFWRSYERGVHPAHFAAVKSLMSGLPETVTDHRGKTGSSHGHSIQGGHVYEDKVSIGSTPREYGGKWIMNVDEAIPHLDNHASKVQKAILKDESILKRYYNGKAYIKAYRGVGGEYARKLKDAVKYDPETHSSEDKNLKIPTAPFSSWTLNRDMADQFARSRGQHVPAEGGGNHSVIMEQWIPVDNVLHSGFHTVHAGQEHAYRNEEEIIVKHPDSKIKIHSKNIHTQHPFQPGITQPDMRPKPFVAKSESLEKGLKGDWKAEGYTMSHSVNDFGDPSNRLAHQHRINVTDKHGNHAGSFIFENTGGNWMATSSHVHPSHQRKGIASAAYQMFEQKTGNKLMPHISRYGEDKQSEDAKALWSNPFRTFGKSESWKNAYVAHKEDVIPSEVYHYSDKEGLKTIEPKYMGGRTASAGQYKGFNPSKIPDFPHTSFHYMKDTPEDIVRQGAKSKYTVKIPKDFKIYNWHEDKDQLISNAIAANQGAFNSEKIMRAIKDAGYHGVWTPKADHPVLANTIQIFHPLPVHKEEKL